MTVSSYIWTTFAKSEQRTDILQCLLQLAAEYQCLGDRKMIVRVDPSPAFVSLKDDSTLKNQNIHLEIGHAKNVNKNPVPERTGAGLGSRYCTFSPSEEQSAL